MQAWQLASPQTSLLALLGDSGGVPVQINMQVNAQLIKERFNKLAEEIQSRALAEPKAILNFHCSAQ